MFKIKITLKLIITFSLLISYFFAFSQSDSVEIHYYKINNELQYGYKKPKPLDLFTNIPKNYVDLGKGFNSKKNLTWIGITIAATGVLIPADQVMLDHVRIQADGTRLAALTSTIIIQPLDYLKTRHIYGQSLYEGGFKNLSSYYKGLSLNLMRIVPHFMITMLMIEYLKVKY